VCTAAPTWARLAGAERDSAGPLRSFLAATAREHGILLVGGTIPVAGEAPGARPHAACFLYAEDGSELARYDKIHLFDVDLPDAQRRYRESDSYAPGERLVCAPTACGMLAGCVLRPALEMFRALGQRGWTCSRCRRSPASRRGASSCCCGRARSKTGYVIAPDQGGRHHA
jgi:nitrilase